MNKKILFISAGLGIILVTIIFVYGFITFQQQDINNNQNSTLPSVTEVQSTPSLGNTDSDNQTILIDDEVVIEPTRLTPIPPPPSLEELNELLQEPMDYESITIRYSQQRDTYILYFAGDQDQATQDFSNLMSEYGYNDINQLNIEYEDLEAPLLERPPVTITLPDEQ